MKSVVFIFITLLLFNKSIAQTPWTLQQCIDYAIKNNITIKQSELNVKLNSLQEQQNKWAQYPNLNADFNNGVSFGRSVDPTSNQFINQGYYFNGLNVGTNVLLFGWFQKKYAVQQSALETHASIEQYKQLQNDVSLNIATAYLRILLAREQIKVAQIQLQADLEQYRQTAIRVAAGQLPELNVAQMQAQVATDSSTLIGVMAEANQSVLDLKAILNMDMQNYLDIVTPNFDDPSVVNVLAYSNAEEIYNIAVTRQNTIAYNGFKIKSAEKQIQIAQANKYPQVNLSWNAGTNYASSYKEPGSTTYLGEVPLGSFQIGDSTIQVTRPDYKVNLNNIPYFKQYGNNFRQSLTVGASIPIFNGYANKINIERAKINLQNMQYIDLQGRQKLQQDIYRAFTDATNTLQKHIAAIRNEQTAKRALELGTKRFLIGMSTTLEYTTLQNNYSRAKANTLSMQYDYIFKTKILDYYAGKNIDM
jgi:outer membrane protein